MEKEEVADRLGWIENNILNIFNQYTNLETEEHDKAITRCVENLEYTLTGRKVARQADVYYMLEQLKGNLEGLKEITEDNREDEKRETIYNLHQTDLEIKQAIKDLENFEIQGIDINGQKSALYSEQLEDYISFQIDKFVSENGIKDPNVIEEIKDEMGRLSKNMVGTHEQVSESMKRTIKSKVQYIGEELVLRNDEAKEKGQESSFEATLGNLTCTKEEVTANDVKDELRNRFNDEQSIDKNSRSDLEAMFK